MTEFLISRGKNRVSAALFDLDGTLVDSLDVHIDSHFAVLASVDAVSERNEVREAWFGANWNTDTLYQSFGARLSIEPEQLVQAHVADMHERYESHVFLPLPGANDLLDAFKKNEMTVAVVTSSSLALAELALQSSGLSGFVDVLVTRERTVRHKPDPEPYIYALQVLGIPSENAVGFEDSWDGLLAALDAGIFSFYLGAEPEPNTRSTSGYECIDSLAQLI